MASVLNPLLYYNCNIRSQISHLHVLTASCHTCIGQDSFKAWKIPACGSVDRYIMRPKVKQNTEYSQTCSKHRVRGTDKKCVLGTSSWEILWQEFGPLPLKGMWKRFHHNAALSSLQDKVVHLRRKSIRTSSCDGSLWAKFARHLQRCFLRVNGL